jgi:hypothetical protein
VTIPGPHQHGLDPAKDMPLRKIIFMKGGSVQIPQIHQLNRQQHSDGYRIKANIDTKLKPLPNELDLKVRSSGEIQPG